MANRCEGVPSSSICLLFFQWLRLLSPPHPGSQVQVMFAVSGQRYAEQGHSGRQIAAFEKCEMQMM